MIVVIAVCTCRNPIGLSNALSGIVEQQTSHTIRVVVVDNDAKREGKSIAEQFIDKLDITYIAEETPGIPYARNTAIRKAMEDKFDYLVMFDDDERPTKGWLDALVQVAQTAKADVVGGPVLPQFEVPPELPVLASDFEKSGPAYISWKLAIDSTANILFSWNLLSSWQGVFFDVRFQHSGGSDSELLRRTSRAGYVHAFAVEAIVIEDIPPRRCSEEWLLRRAFRNGNVLGRVSMLHKGPMVAFTQVLIRACLLRARGIARGLTSGKNLRKQYLSRRDIARSNGMIEALSGKVMQEYADPTYRN